MLLKAMDRRRKTVGAACLAAGLFAATGASAGTMVTDWAYTLQNGFTAHRSFKDCVQSPIMGDTCSDANPGTIDGTVQGSQENTDLTSPNPNPVPPNPAFGPGNMGFSQAWTRLQWANEPPNDPNPISALEIDASGDGDDTVPGKFSGTITTGAGFENTVTLTHTNMDLNNSRANFLWDATLTDVLQIQPVAPPGPEFTAPIITIGINFRETLNSGGPVGSADIFVVDLDDVTADGIDFVCDMDGECTIVQEFDFDMFTYQATIALESLNENVQSLHVLTDDECEEAGAATGCIGVRTPENQTSTFQAKFKIDKIGEVVVPEPGTLALLGIGLVGLGLTRRRRAA